MATLTAGINFRFNFKTGGFDRFANSLRQLRIQFLGFEQVGQILDRVGDALLGVGAAGAKSLAAIVKPAAQFDDTMTQIGALAQDATFDVDQLAQSFLEISNVLPLSAQELAITGVEAVRAGQKTRAAIESIALVSGKLAAISSDLSEQQAAKQLIAISTQFGKTGDAMTANVARLGDAFAKLQNIGIGTAGELANITKRFGFMADAMGISQEQTIAFAAAFRQTGIQVEVAGTAMQKFLTKFASQSARFAAAAKLDVKEVQGLINSGQGLTAVFKFLAGITDNNTVTLTELQERMAKLGIRGARLSNALLALAKKTDIFTGAMAVAGQTTGALDEIFGKFSTSLVQKFRTLEGSVKNIAIAFGGTLKPILVGVIDLLLALFEIVLKIPPVFKFLTVVVFALVTALFFTAGALIAAAAALIAAAIATIFLMRSYKDLRKEFGLTKTILQININKLRALSKQTIAAALSNKFLGKSVEALKGPVKKLTGLIDKFTPAAVTAAIAGGGIKAAMAGAAVIFAKVALVVGVVVLTIVVLRKEIGALFDSVSALLRPIGELVVTIFTLGGALKGGFGSALFSFFRVLLSPAIAVLKVVEFIVRAIAALFQGIADGVRDGLFPLQETFDRIRLMIANIVEGFQAFGERLGFVSKEGGSLMDTLLAPFVLLGDVLAFVLEILFRVVSFIVDVFAAALGGIVEGFLTAFTPVLNIFVQIKDEIALVLEELRFAAAPIIEAFSELFGIIGDGSDEFDTFGIVVQAFAALTRVLLAPIVFIVKAFAIAIKALVFVFTGLASLVVPFLRATKVFLVPIIKSFSVWLKRTKALGKSFKNLSDSIKRGFKDIGDFAGGIVDKVLFTFDNIADSVRFIFQSATAAVTSMFDAIIRKFQDTIIAFTNVLNGAIRSANKLPGVKIALLTLPSFGTGGQVEKSGLALVHKGEVIGKPGVLPPIASKMPLPSFTFPAPAATTSGALPATAMSPSEGGSIEITIPVTVMLDDIMLGTTLVRVSDEQIRRELGTRGIRLGGVG